LAAGFPDSGYPPCRRVHVPFDHSRNTARSVSTPSKRAGAGSPFRSTRNVLSIGHATVRWGRNRSSAASAISSYPQASNCRSRAGSDPSRHSASIRSRSARPAGSVSRSRPRRSGATAAERRYRGDDRPLQHHPLRGTMKVQFGRTVAVVGPELPRGRDRRGRAGHARDGPEHLAELRFVDLKHEQRHVRRTRMRILIGRKRAPELKGGRVRERAHSARQQRTRFQSAAM